MRDGTKATRARRFAPTAAQLRQLAWNLVRNAVQASSAGDAVRVRVQRDARDHAVLEVSDRGIGIDEQAKVRLFDAFFTTRSQGTGVGLAVVKRIADEHGFSIEVTSERGRGATFRVDLGRDRRRCGRRAGGDEELVRSRRDAGTRRL